MTVSEFIRHAKDDYIYTIVNANMTGYLSHPEKCKLNEGNKSYIVPRYGDLQLVGFDVATKRRILIYVAALD